MVHYNVFDTASTDGCRFHMSSGIGVTLAYEEQNVQCSRALGSIMQPSEPPPYLNNTPRPSLIYAKSIRYSEELTVNSDESFVVCHAPACSLQELSETILLRRNPVSEAKDCLRCFRSRRTENYDGLIPYRRTVKRVRLASRRIAQDGEG